MFTDGVLDEYIAACHRCRDHIGPRLDTVRNDRIVRRTKAWYTVNFDAVGPRAANLRPHHIKEVRKIHNLRLKRRILQNRLPFGTGCRHHDVLRRADAWEIEINQCTLQSMRCARMDRPLRDLNLGTQSLKALEMQIDGTRPDRAASGQRDLRPSFAREERPHDEKGGTHLSDKLIRSTDGRNLRRVDMQTVVCRLIFCANPKRLKDCTDRIDIFERRYILEHSYTAAAEQGRRDDRQHRILRPADLHASAQRIPPMNDQLFHSPSSSLRLIPLP